jgi:hypothetical protein
VNTRITFSVWHNGLQQHPKLTIFCHDVHFSGHQAIYLKYAFFGSNRHLTNNEPFSVPFGDGGNPLPSGEVHFAKWSVALADEPFDTEKNRP